MALAKEKPLFAQPEDYEDDFEIWSYQQAELLRQHRFNELDIANLVEEVESMGSEQRFALQSSYRLFISHLLKWQFQPKLRSSSWDITIGRERDHIAVREAKNRALRESAKALIEEIYRGAVREAAKETGLPYSAFPFVCPYTIEQFRDPEWMPD